MPRASHTTFSRLFGFALIVMLTMGALPFARPAAAQGGPKLSKHDRALIAAARASGQSEITLLIAAVSGKNAAAAADVAAQGGRVQFREDDIDYLRAIVPLGKVEALARSSNIKELEPSELIPLDDPRPDGATPATPQTPPSASTPNNNPYMPTGDTGAAQFIAANPQWDGRGVTIGILDSGVDLGHPALATTTTGERKVVDWVTYTDPSNGEDPTWVRMADQVSGASFSYQNVIYTAPAAASYRIGLFNERSPQLGGEVGNDVNRDGNPAGSKGIFAVLWNAVSNTVYVDTNQNNSFADEQAMTDYKVRNDIGTFGTDNPATDVREAMPFVVQTDGKNKLVNIGITSSAHGTHVAGITAANGMFGGAMTGAAPGAKLVSVRVCLFSPSCSSYALVEGMIFAAKQANVDVINMSIGGLPSLNDGNNTRVVLYDRLIEKYNVQMFISAGNSGPGMNTIGDPSLASKVVSVGSYITKATWQKNYGSDSEFQDNLHYYSSTGPREDGGFKPNVVAPGSAISTVPTWQAGSPVAGTYALPAGYAMFNGTSMAAPQAAGAAALLLSAAKQSNVQRQPAQLRQALVSSARLLDTSRYQPYEQGNGLIDVGAAWNLMKTNRIKAAIITSQVRVNTVLSGFLATPGVGQGIYDREGVTVGQSYTREYTFVRTTGGSKAVTYNLSWVGNDGTFSSATSISLPLNRAVKLTVSINPATTGSHSAILNLDDPTTTGVDYQTMNVVVVADQFNAGNNYTVVQTGTVGRNQVLSYFFRVPAGAPALKVDFSGPSGTAGTGQARFLRWHPYGVGIDSNASTACYIPATDSCNGSSRTTTNPFAGVWEVTVDGRRTSDAANVPFTLTVSILGASVSPNPDVINSAQPNVGVSRSYTLTNLYGTFTGNAVGTNLGSARVDRPTIADGAVREFQVTVDAGSTSLTARIGNPSDPAADLDLFVLNAAGQVLGQSADGDSEEAVTITNPAAGTYTVRIDGYAVPAGSTAYDYLDVFANTKFGTIAVTDASAVRPAGTSWTVPAVVTAKVAPAAGRILLGNVQARTSTGTGTITIGSGDVRVLNVAP